MERGAKAFGTGSLVRPSRPSPLHEFVYPSEKSFDGEVPLVRSLTQPNDGETGDTEEVLSDLDDGSEDAVRNVDPSGLRREGYLRSKAFRL